jgi:hypothetical protein
VTFIEPFVASLNLSFSKKPTFTKESIQKTKRQPTILKIRKTPLTNKDEGNS